MLRDDSAFAWFCAEMTDILAIIYQIARESKSTTISSIWGFT